MEEGEDVHSTYISKHHTEIIEEKPSIRELLGRELCCTDRQELISILQVIFDHETRTAC